MKIPKVAKAVGGIDEMLIENAEKSNSRRRKNVLKWSAAAACIALAAVVCAAVFPRFFEKETKGRYKDVNITASEAEIVWPWELLTPPERFTEITVNGTTFESSGSFISKELVGESMGVYPAKGYDPITYESHDAEFEVYGVKYADTNTLVAVLIEEKHYVYKIGAFSPPDTLGELFDTVNLSDVIPLSRFSENGDGPDKKHYVLIGDEFIWKTLEKCRSAPFVKDEKWNVYEQSYISFSVTSEVLGVYKRAMYITEDGHLWTNAFDYGYQYNIGKEAAEEIIEYAKSNSEKAEYEPYLDTVIGTVTKITEEYIFVDDTVLCKNSKDGIVYKIPRNNPGINRYVEHGVIRTGDSIQVYCKEKTDSPPYIIENAYSLEEVIISSEDVIIQE